MSMFRFFAHAFQTRLSHRLAASYAVMGLLMVALSGMSAWQLLQQDASFGQLLDTTVPELTSLQSIGAEVDEVNMAARDAMLAEDAAGVTKALARIESGRSVIGQQIEALQANFRRSGTQGQELAEQLGTHSSGILVTLVKFSRLHKAHRIEQAKALFDRELQGKMQSLSDTIKRGQALELSALARQKEASRKQLHMALAVGAGILLAVVAASVVLTWTITRSITEPVQEAVALAKRVAQGDLSSPVRVTRRDEIGQLQDAMAQMQNRLNQLIHGILATVHRIEVTSEDIARGNSDLSMRTERAGETLHRTTSAMEALASTFMQSADSARSANELVHSASEGATRSGNVVSQVVSNMQDISASSSKIADIISVIDGIAFQTNILALNAAVEAARAGEQGRGFAVVASEVRALAQRSATAAREIKTLIQASVEKVHTGSELVSEAGLTMQQLIAQVGKVNQLINTISQISAEQTEGVSQVNASVNELDEATQSNASLVHHTSGAAAKLKAETDKLSQAVGVFKLC
jgi:methyl-accepting chemotaxis protein